MQRMLLKTQEWRDFLSFCKMSGCRNTLRQYINSSVKFNVSNKTIFFKLISLGLDLNIVTQGEHYNLKVLLDGHTES